MNEDDLRVMLAWCRQEWGDHNDFGTNEMLDRIEAGWSNAPTRDQRELVALAEKLILLDGARQEIVMASVVRGKDWLKKWTLLESVTIACETAISSDYAFDGERMAMSAAMTWAADKTTVATFRMLEEWARAIGSNPLQILIEVVEPAFNDFKQMRAEMDMFKENQ